MPSGGWEKTSPAEKGPKKRKEVEPTEKKQKEKVVLDKKSRIESNPLLSPVDGIEASSPRAEADTCAWIEANQRDEARVISHPTAEASNQAEVGLARPFAKINDLLPQAGDPMTKATKVPQDTNAFFLSVLQ